MFNLIILSPSRSWQICCPWISKFSFIVHVFCLCRMKNDHHLLFCYFSIKECFLEVCFSGMCLSQRGSSWPLVLSGSVQCLELPSRSSPQGPHAAAATVGMVPCPGHAEPWRPRGCGHHTAHVCLAPHSETDQPPERAKWAAQCAQPAGPCKGQQE